MASEDIVKILGGPRNIQQGTILGAFGKGKFSQSTASSRRQSSKLPRSTWRFVLKTQAVASVSEWLEYPAEDLLWILNVSGRTAQRRQTQGALSEDESDRLYRVARVTQMAERVFDSKEKAREWLKKRNLALQGEVPLELLATDAGAELVTDELTRIDYGDLY